MTEWDGLSRLERRLVYIFDDFVYFLDNELGLAKVVSSGDEMRIVNDEKEFILSSELALYIRTEEMDYEDVRALVGWLDEMKDESVFNEFIQQTPELLDITWADVEQLKENVWSNNENSRS